MFKTLIELLKFKETFEPAAPLVFAHLKRVQELLNKFLSTDPTIDEPLRHALAHLPEESIFRLISSPYLCELLMIQRERPADPLRQQILQALVAEVLAVNPDFNYPLNPSWTIDGDVVLNPEIAAKFPAVQTSCGIRLNYQSYIHNTGKAGIGGYDHSMALKHKERLETAKAIIAQVSASALSLVDTFTTTIQFRINKNKDGVVNSSTHTSIGLIRCENFHALHEDMPEIVDMLVHESIHQYLHLFEEEHAAFVNLSTVPADKLDVRIFPSPWSGHPLDFRSYTHAILVWYGLRHFWSQYLESGFQHPEISREQAEQKLREAEFGFVNSSCVLDNLGETAQHLNADYAIEIRQIS